MKHKVGIDELEGGNFSGDKKDRRKKRSAKTERDFDRAPKGVMPQTDHRHGESRPRVVYTVGGAHPDQDRIDEIEELLASEDAADVKKGLGLLEPFLAHPKSHLIAAEIFILCLNSKRGAVRWTALEALRLYGSPQIVGKMKEALNKFPPIPKHGKTDWLLPLRRELVEVMDDWANGNAVAVERGRLIEKHGKK